MNGNKRLFFAVNLPSSLKQEIAETVLPLIPKEKWRKVLPQNLHITIQFLGYLPKEAVMELQAKTGPLQKIEAFEAEVNCVGHFKNKVLWLGIGKGTEEFGLLSKKLEEALGTSNGRFHAHVTLARNRGAEAAEVKAIVEKIRPLLRSRKIPVESLDLMESFLQKAGPRYEKVFSIRLSKGLL
jgi:2'-5' RNA ligase